ncbi:MAG TPA: four helix bundle protein [Gemmatimonadaceae bacterium]|nr:four helix bundle protein [Gemmatimonadaceae bacterium]
MGDFRKLKVWEKAHGVAVRAHRLAKSMRDSRYAPLRNQIIRAAESIPTNIVEGSRKSTNADFARFLDYALNSASELEYQLMLARDIGAAEEEETSLLITALTEIRKMLHGLIRRVKSSPRPNARKKPKRR